VGKIIPKIINLDAGVSTKGAEECLQDTTSLTDALNKFKQTNKDTLPVFERGNFLGYLKKDQLLREVTHLFDSKGGGL
jgi:nitrogenase molybdenum-iron protein alpha/beta subunit